MNKSFIIFLIFSLSSLIFAESKLIKSKRDTLSIVVIPSIKPVSYIDDDGTPSGLFSDLIREIAKENNFSVEFHEMSWNEGMEAVLAGKVDLMPAAIYTKERDELYDYHTIPVMVSWGVLAIHQKTYLENINELEGKKIAIMKGGQNGKSFTDLITKLGISCSIVEVANHNDMIPMIESGEIYGGVFFNSFNLNSSKINYSSVVFNPVQSFFITSKTNEHNFLNLIDKQLEEWKKDKKSVYYFLLRKYFTHDVINTFEFPAWLKIAGILILILGISTYIWLLFLRRIIKNKTKEILANKKILEEQERLFRLVADHTASWEYWMLPNGNMNYVSPSSESITGFSPKEFYSNPNKIFEIIHPDDKNIWDNHNCHTSNGNNTAADIQFRILKKNGDVRWINHTCVSMLENGKFIGKRSSNRDITILKNTQKNLQQAQKMQAIGTLAGGIAHDFNNILSAIIGYSELSIVYCNNGSEIKEFIEQILLAGIRAKDLVKQILTFSRKTETKLQPLKISTIAKEVLKLLRSSIPTTIMIESDISEDCEMVLADSTQIHQIIMNLCTNANHAMKKHGGTLSVSLEQINISSRNIIQDTHNIQPGKYILLNISDTGCGIPKNNLERIFEPYFTTKETGEGTGLGLATVHGIIKSYNGHIFVKSDVDKGTTFEIYLPVIESTITEKSTKENDNFRGNERILVVDDDKVLSEMLLHSLTSLGYKVTSFSDSEEALNTFIRNPNDFDLIITDMTMPKLTGIELSQAIMAVKPDIPIILCTGFSDIMDSVIAKESGVNAFLQKPITNNDLAKTIRSMLT